MLIESRDKKERKTTKNHGSRTTTWVVNKTSRVEKGGKNPGERNATAKQGKSHNEDSSVRNEEHRAQALQRDMHTRGSMSYELQRCSMTMIARNMR